MAQSPLCPGRHVARRDISATCSCSCMHIDHGVHVLFGLRCGSLPRTKRQFTELEVISVDQKYGDLHKDVQTFVNFILPACFTPLKYFVMIGCTLQRFALSMALHLCATGWHVVRRDTSAACSSSCMHKDEGVHVLFWFTLRFTSANSAVHRLQALQPRNFDD